MSVRRKIYLDPEATEQDLLTCNDKPCSNNGYQPAKDKDNEGGVETVSSDTELEGNAVVSSPQVPYLQPINFQTFFSDIDSLRKNFRDELALSEGPLTRSNQQTPKADTAVFSEPSLLACATCKSVYSSSWFLAQHVQKTHGLRIYVEPTNSTSPRQQDFQLVSGWATDVADTIGEKKVTSPQSSEKSSSPQVSKDVFSPPSTAPFLQSNSQSWNPYTPLLQTGIRLVDVPFRPTTGGIDSNLDDTYSQRLHPLAGNSAAVENSSLNFATSGLLFDTPSAFLAPGKKKKAAEGKRYKCDVCSKTFRFPSTLAAHHRKHTGEKPFKCTLCTKAYTLESKLEKHLVKTHKFPTSAVLEENAESRMEGDSDSSEKIEPKPFKCTLCTKAYTLASKLEKHLVKAHGKFPTSAALEENAESKKEGDSDSREDIGPEDSQEFALLQAEGELHNLSSQANNSQDNCVSLLCDVMKKTGIDKIPQYKEGVMAERRPGDGAVMSERCPGDVGEEASDACTEDWVTFY